MQSKLIRLAAVALASLPLSAMAVTIDIIPRPQEVRVGDGQFRLTAATGLKAESPLAADAVSALISRFTTAGIKLAADSTASSQIILTTENADPSLGDEGYQLDVTASAVTIRATGAAGFFYGVQSLLQLLPPTLYASKPIANAEWTVPAVSIQDKPRFKWRGLMLDVSRHFEPKDQVLRYLDQMAMHKLNVFHWHLVDDQGWRIQIRKYPKLTEVGAWRPTAGFGIDAKESTTYGPDGRYGGFYTQDEVREVVAYAAKLHITIVPEIEMPGHSTAGLAAYPEFGSSPGPFKVDADAGIFRGIYNPADEATYTFLEDVLSEVIELFPGRYIHIGGDEVPKEPWKNNAACQALTKREGLKNDEELQAYFTARISKFIAAKGRHMIGWDEILEGGLAPDAAVMSWRGTSGGLAAAQAGHDVVMSPTTHCYLDYEQSLGTEPRERGSVVTLEKIYSYEPIPKGLAADKTHHVMGVQGNLWTEYVPNLAYAEYMTWPRGAALAEVGWTEPKGRDFSDFERRLGTEEQRLDALGINYRPVENKTLAGSIHLGTDRKSIVIENPINGATIRYTTDGTYPTTDSPTYTAPVPMPSGLVHVAARFFIDGRVATPVAAASFLDGRPVHVRTSAGQEWETRGKFFFAVRWGIGADDTVTVTFDEGPQTLKSIAVVSGDGVKPGSRWQNGTLELSDDGKTFTTAADFKEDGTATADCSAKPVAAFQIRLTKEQRPKPVIRTVTLQ